MAVLTFENTKRTASVGDIRLNYQEAGTGEAVVMLHGGGPGASGWSNFSRNIEAISQKYRVLLLDQPGFGHSDKPKLSGPLGETFAALVKGFLDALKIPQAHFLGNSMGGLVASKLSMMHPSYVGRLVLMGPAAGVSFVSPNPSEGRKMMVDYYSSPRSPERLRQFLNTLMYDQSVLSDSEFEARFKASEDRETEEWYKQHMFTKDGLVMEDYWRDFEKITHQTLLLWGRDDRVCPLDRGLFMVQRMPNARLYVIPKCGHWVQAEQPELFNRTVLDFLTHG